MHLTYALLSCVCGETEIGFHRDVINWSAEQKKPVIIDRGPEMIRWLPMPLIEGRDEKHAKTIIVIGLFSRRMVFALIDRRRPIMFVAVFFPMDIVFYIVLWFFPCRHHSHLIKLNDYYDVQRGSSSVKCRTVVVCSLINISFHFARCSPLSVSMWFNEMEQILDSIVSRKWQCFTCFAYHHILAH